jgi:hypothetical protein
MHVNVSHAPSATPWQDNDMNELLSRARELAQRISDLQVRL